MRDAPHEHESKGAGHEPDLARASRVFLSSAMLALLLSLSLWIVYDVLTALTRQKSSIEPASLVELPPPKVAGPRLNPDQPRELEALRRQENTLLDTYGWVDRHDGVARIPIARAMAILAERGLSAAPSKHEAAP